MWHCHLQRLQGRLGMRRGCIATAQLWRGAVAEMTRAGLIMLYHSTRLRVQMLHCRVNQRRRLARLCIQRLHG